MRPVRLELEGFTAFRRPTVVDFEGADLFALSGATGAGKTSLIDAMTFALYGSVPRLDGRAVAPVISQGLAEARVRFDFTVGGAPYVAARVVRATKTGATTREARLEQGDGTVLAGDAAALTAAVTELLGLDFIQFTTCVSLPQGEFARFLHAEPRHRQDLLVKLLDLGLYAEVGSMARQRAALAEQAAQLAVARLEKLADATPEARAAAVARVGVLSTLRDDIVTPAEPELAAARAGEAAAEAAATTAGRALALLRSVRVPDGVEAIAARVGSAVEARRIAAEAEDAAAAAVAVAAAAADALPDRAGLEAHQRDYGALVEQASLREKGEAALVAIAAAEQEALAALAETSNQATAAAARLQQTRTADAAHALAADLHAGDECPVCGNVVGDLPVASTHLQEAVAEAEVTIQLVARAQAAADAAGQERARVETRLAGVIDTIDTVGGRLSGAAPLDAVTASLAEVAAAEAALADCRKALELARGARAQADRDAADATTAELDARRSFDAARDAVAALGPPPADRLDLAADWAALADWAEGERPVHTAEQAARQAAAAEHRQAGAAVAERVATACAEAGVESGTDPRNAVGDAIARADAEVRRISDAIDEAVELRATSAGDLATAAVATALAGHLKADRFERWLLAEALSQLVAGATVLLHELSGNAYSLAVDDKGTFVVIDHVNAEQRRSARTLSGGETFLASLALALALADQVAGLAAGGAARLETMLLDEGFGTLDPESLDTVATALEELGARGRTVGIVTHVRELAERMPVRFEVRKVAGAATVTRVDS